MVKTVYNEVKENMKSFFENGMGNIRLFQKCLSSFYKK